MNISNLTIEQVDAFYRNDVDLYKMALPDDEIIRLEMGKELSTVPNELMLGIKHEGELISIIRGNPFTPICYIIHICIATKWQHKGLSKHVRDVYFQHLADVTTLQKVVCPAPSTCIPANKALQYAEFENEGTFKNIMPWRGEIVDLIWYSYDLNKYRGIEQCQS